MNTLKFYEDKNGNSQIWDFFESLRIKAKTSKDARIQFKQLNMYMELLQENGTRLNENITKHIEDGIWELRYFYFYEDTYVLLHRFRKKSQKTPKSEIEQAKRERDDYISRMGG